MPKPIESRVTWRYVREWATFLARLLAELWASLRRVSQAVHPARVSLWTVVFAGGALLVSGQGQDMYVEIAEDAKALRWFGLLLGTLAIGLMAWYCARVAVSVAGTSDVSHEVGMLRRQAPRWLGYLAHLLVAAGLTRAAIGDRSPLYWLLFAVVAASALIFTNRWLDNVESHSQREELRQRLFCYLGLTVLVPVLGALVGLFGVSTELTPLPLVLLAVIVLTQGSAYLFFVKLRRSLFGYEELNAVTPQLRATTRVMHWTLAGASAVVFVLLWIYPVYWGRVSFGPAFIVLVGLCWLIGLGTRLTTASQRWSFPVLTSAVLAIALLMAIVAPWFDGHDLRVVESTDIDTRPTISDVFEQWRKQQPQGKSRVPLFIVAAEGGGSRAAYWTATILGRLQDRSNGAFAEHLLAISSVSGGSFGSVTFRALVADGSQSAKRDGQNITGDNHLGPQLARLLTVDLLQIPLLLFSNSDRGVALELGREASWRQFMNTDRFQEPFLDLWQQEPWPALFINSTIAESGRRAVVSNVRLRTTDTIEFNEVYDLLAEIGKDMPLSTAADTSSRFPYVSPPGTFTTTDGARGHVVDGGYFENFGAATALDILLALNEEFEEHHTEVVPVVIQISNNNELPDNVGDWKNGRGEPVRAGNYEPIKVGLETTTPPRTLLATRNARGWSDTERLRRTVEELGGRYIHFRLPSDTRVPTGRILSERAKQALRGDDDDNRDALKAVLDYLMITSSTSQGAWR